MDHHYLAEHLLNNTIAETNSDMIYMACAHALLALADAVKEQTDDA